MGIQKKMFGDTSRYGNYKVDVGWDAARCGEVVKYLIMGGGVWQVLYYVVHSILILVSLLDFTY